MELNELLFQTTLMALLIFVTGLVNSFMNVPLDGYSRKKRIVINLIIPIEVTIFIVLIGVIFAKMYHLI